LGDLAIAPAFDDELEHLGFTLGQMRRKRWACRAPRLRGKSTQLTKDLAKVNSDLDATITAGEQTAAVRRTAVFQAVGLLLFGGLALLTVIAIFTQLLARQIF